jgi:DNA-binding CsgD family transcriptional regulator/PAS domain-containing protein
MVNQIQSTAIEAIYAAAANPGLWPEALQAIADCFDDHGAILIYSQNDGHFGALSSASLTTMMTEYGAHWTGQDIRAIRARERGFFLSDIAITDADVVSPEEEASHPFYTQFLRRHGNAYFAASSVYPTAKLEVALSIQRQQGRDRYSTAELTLVRMLSRHVENAMRLSARLMDHENIARTMNAALENISVGMFAIDAQCEVIFSNRRGRALLGDGLDVVNNRLIATKTQADLNAALREVRNCAINSETWLRPILIKRTQASFPLLAYLLPQPKQQPWVDLASGHVAVIVLLTEIDQENPLDPDLLRCVFGLTIGEARLAVKVAGGLRPGEAAAELGISHHTARTVLKSVFQKMGVSRQTDLVRLTSGLRSHVQPAGAVT